MTQMLHAHKGPPLPNPTRVHNMVSTPCRSTVTAIIPKHVHFHEMTTIIPGSLQEPESQRVSTIKVEI